MDHATSVRLISISLVAGLAGSAMAANPSDFQVFNYDQGNDGTVDVYGQLFKPTGLDSSKDYPIVVFFHGAGEYNKGGSTTNTAQINTYIDNLLAAAKTNKFYLYAPQSSSGGWVGWQVDEAMAMVAQAVQTYQVDPSRIYLTGLSAGGEATWETMSRYSDLVAAGVPLSTPSTTADASKLAHKPIWAYHAINDGGLTDVGNTRNLINGVLAADGLPTLSFPLTSNTGAPYYSDGSKFVDLDNSKLRYSEYSSGGHSNATWGRAYAEPALYTWLQAQSTSLHVLQSGEKVLVDFGQTAMATTDAQGRTWNSTGTGPGVEKTISAPVMSFALTSTGQRTAISISVTKAFFGTTSSGVTTGSTYSPNVAADGWIAGDWGNENAPSKPAEVAVQGLTPGQAYQLVVFGSMADTLDSPSVYTVGVQSQTLQTHGNADGTVVFDNVLADANGEIRLGVAVPVTGVHNNSFASLNALTVTAVPEPTGMLALLGAGSLLLRRRK